MGRQASLIQQYPPKSFVCPGCGKAHSKAHYHLPGQIDFTKKPGEKGRILFNRRNKDDRLADDTPVDKALPMRGEPKDDEGNPRDLYCPHCGWTADAIILVRTGELPSKVDRFFQEEGYDKVPKTWRKLLNDFITWWKKREDGL